MGPRVRVKSLALLGLALLAIAAPARAEPEFPRLTKEECGLFFKKILEDTDEDLAVIPFAERNLRKIYAVLHAPHPTSRKLLDAIYAEDIRRMAYRLRALASSLESVDPLAFRALSAEFKVLEKAIGDAVFESEMVASLFDGPGLQKLVTPAMETLFLGRLQATEDRLLQNLRRFGWTGNKKKNAYWYVLTTIETRAPIKKNSFLKKNVVELQAKELRKIHERVADGELDPREIEDGVHELRRQIREILLTFTAYDGMFYLDESIRFAGVPARKPGPLKWLVPKGEDLLKNPIALPRDAYLSLVQAVKDLGDMKAKDGIREFIAEALKELPVSPGARNRALIQREAAALLAAVEKSDASVTSLERTREAATAYFAEIERSRVLLQFANYLDKLAKRL